MTKDEIIKLIEDNGLTLHGDIEHFAALVAEHTYTKYLELPEAKQSGTISITMPAPIAYLCENATGHKYFRWKKPSSVYKSIPLYTTPPQPEQEPVANYCKECLTYNGHHEGCSHYTNPPQRTEQEQQIETLKRCLFQMQEAAKDLVEQAKSLPPQREWQGLTDEEIKDAGQLTVEGERMLPYSFARAIEAKLKEKNA